MIRVLAAVAEFVATAAAAAAVTVAVGRLAGWGV
jgi:hypothetical protein